MIQLYIRGELVTVRNGEASCPTNHDIEREVRALGGIAPGETPVAHAQRLAKAFDGEVLSIGDEERKASEPPESAPEETVEAPQATKAKARK